MINNSDTHKLCSKCNEVKPRIEFYKTPTRDGNKAACKHCLYIISKKWVKNNPERLKAYKKKWSDNNPEKNTAANKKWSDNNPEKVNAANKKWREDNREKIDEYSRRYENEARKTKLVLTMLNEIRKVAK